MSGAGWADPVGVPRTRGQRHEPPDVMSLAALAPFTGVSFAPHGDYEAIEIVDRDFTGQLASDATFLECRLERCDLDGVSMRRARMADCLLADISAASIDLGESAWRDVLVTGARFGAMTATGATWSRVRVRGGKLNFVDLSAARLADVVFEACEIGALDLAGADLRSVRFPGCTVDELSLAGAKLSDVDLSGATLASVRDVASLRGATISFLQLIDLAPLLAEHVGLTVHEG